MGGGFEDLSDGGCVFGGLARAQVKSFEAAVGKPAVEGGWDGSDGILEECKAFIDVVGVEGGNTHQDILVRSG